jgi:hypothetical protein
MSTYAPAMPARRQRALALLPLLMLWLLGQGAHDPLVHAGEWSHAGGGDHSSCSFFQGLHQIETAAVEPPAPQALRAGQASPAPTAGIQSASLHGIDSRAPPRAA